MVAGAACWRMGGCQECWLGASLTSTATAGGAARWGESCEQLVVEMGWWVQLAGGGCG